MLMMMIWLRKLNRGTGWRAHLYIVVLVVLPLLVTPPSRDCLAKLDLDRQHEWALEWQRENDDLEDIADWRQR